MRFAGLLQRLIGAATVETLVTRRRARLVVEQRPPTIYAIGDVHGRLDLLDNLEAQIHRDGAGEPGEKWIVMLGDYIDRGPQSAQVLEHLLKAPPEGFKRICLAGNHEELMLAFLERPTGARVWLDLGGRETLTSYGARDAATLRADQRGLSAVLDYLVPAEHRQFLDDLPIMLETRDHIFVHAGLRSGVYLAVQADEDLLWIRDDFATSYLEFGKLVVHGHTPRNQPLITASRIAIDTGSFATDILTAVRLRRGSPPMIFDTRGVVRVSDARP